MFAGSGVARGLSNSSISIRYSIMKGLYFLLYILKKSQVVDSLFCENDEPIVIYFSFRACWGFIFGGSDTRFYAEQGVDEGA